MAQRCPRSRPLGLARLPRHRFIVTRDGYASVDSRPARGGPWRALGLRARRCPHARQVRGARQRALREDQPAGDRARAAPSGRWSMSAARATSARPRPGYMETVIASAKHWALPEAYVAGMNSVPEQAESRCEAAEISNGAADLAARTGHGRPSASAGAEIDAGLTFSPRGRRWQREALTDEGSRSLTRKGPLARPFPHPSPLATPSPRRGEGNALRRQPLRQLADLPLEQRAIGAVLAGQQRLVAALLDHHARGRRPGCGPSRARSRAGAR